MAGRSWSKDEDALVRAEYRRRGGIARLCAALPHRARMSIVKRASQMRANIKPAWAPRELETLRREWHEVGPRVLRAKLRGRTWCAIRGMAQRLGLPGGVPQGYETLGAAATRTGFPYHSLARVLAWAGVRIGREYPSKDRRPRANRTHTVVAPDAVDAAVRRWLAAENVSAAARARGLDPKVLDYWLRRAGELGPPRPRGQRTFRRVPTAAIDRVVAARAVTHRPRARRAA